MSDEPSGEDATESAPLHSYTIAAYMNDGRTCEGVVRALGQVMRTDPHELPPLYTAVACDALEQLFHPRRDGRTRTDVTVTFTYDRYRVTISADGRLTIQA